MHFNEPEQRLQWIKHLKGLEVEEGRGGGEGEGGGASAGCILGECNGFIS